MNRVEVNAQEIEAPPWAERAAGFSMKVLDLLGLQNWELSLLFCGPELIRRLNCRYRSTDEETDVLSFPLGVTRGKGKSARFMAGDIVISIKNLQENSKYFKVSEDEELRRLLVHGILHLAGEDHESNSPEEAMLRRQEEILARLGGESIL